MTSTSGRERRMSHVDRMWLRMDDPTNLMMITGVIFFDEKLDRSEVIGLIAERLLGIPRFGQRIETIPGRGGHRWVEADDVDLDWHLQEVSLPEPGDDSTLRDFVDRWISRPLDLSRPLWQVHLIQGYRGGSAMLWRLHHCIGDGIALMLVLLSMTDLEADPSPSASNPLRSLFDTAGIDRGLAKRHLEEVLPQTVKLLSLPSEVMAGLSRWRKGGASIPAFGRLVLRPPDRKTPFRGGLGVPKRVAWTEPLAMDDVLTIRSGLGGTVNDILTNAVAGGLRRYLEARGQLRGGLQIRAVVPVSLRPIEEMRSLGNQFGLIFLSLPVAMGDTRQRLAEVSRRLGKLKRSFEPVVAMRIMGILGAVPHRLQRAAVRIFGTKGTAVLTNVPGPTRTLYLAGKAMTGFMFWVPQAARLGMGISILSYRGEVRIGVVTDAGLVPDPEELVTGMQREFEVMLRLADEALPRGR